MHRYGSIIKLKPDKVVVYKELHANVWPDVLNMIHECNIRNYSIFFKDGYLFSYFEYVGNDLDADMRKMAADPKTIAWWKLTDPCQEPLETRKPDEWWAVMEEYFHMD
jgi:L-rhamnose mutarotase